MAADPAKTTNLATVLGLVVEHGYLHLADLCRLLKVSSSCRLAVQQARSEQQVLLDWSAVHEEDGRGALAHWEQRRAQLQGFAEWLPGHAGLITQFHLRVGADEARLLQRHLALALRVCRLAAAAAATAAAATRSGAAVCVAAAAKPVPLRLEACRVAGSFPEQQLLQELGAAGLQELEVFDVWEQPANILPTYFASLSSSLQSLSLLTHEDLVPSDGLRAAVERLTALTSLGLWRVPVAAGFQLPPMLRHLDISYDEPTTSDSGSGSDSDGDSTHTSAGLLRLLGISSLAGLQHLRLGLWGAGDVPGGLGTLALPPNLTSLSMYADIIGDSMPVSRVTGAGSSLQEVRVEDLTDASSAVLTYLCRLPGVRRLVVKSCVLDTPEASGAVAAALGSATGLTGLCLLNVGFEAGSGLCRQLASLPGLKSLVLEGVALPGGPNSDWLRLTALTSLTKLSLSNLQWADDVVVAALAGHLTGLCDLHVEAHDIGSLALLPVVGALTGLTRLILRGGPRFVVLADKLMLLSGLTQLAELEIRTLGCSEAEKQQFREGLPRLRDF